MQVHIYHVGAANLQVRKETAKFVTVKVVTVKFFAVPATAFVTYAYVVPDVKFAEVSFFRQLFRDPPFIPNGLNCLYCS